MNEPTDDAALQAFARIIDQVQLALRTKVAGGIGPLSDRPQSWGFVSWDTAEVMRELRLARSATQARRPTFLECGSGLGFVGAMAAELGFKVTGIEISPAYIDVSRTLFPTLAIEQADLETFEGYDKFDVVYYYCPFADDAVAATFERRVEKSLKSGGIIIANRKLTHDHEGFDTLHTDGLSFVLKKQ